MHWRTDKLLNINKLKKNPKKVLTQREWHDIIIKLSDESNKQKANGSYKKYLEN